MEDTPTCVPNRVSNRRRDAPWRYGLFSPMTQSIQLGTAGLRASKLRDGPIGVST